MHHHTTTAHIVGLRHYIPEPFLASILDCTDTARMPLQGKTVYLMSDKGCEQDDNAVMAYDAAGNPLGHVSRMESVYYAQLLGNEITASIQGRVVGVNAIRRSLVVEIEDHLQEELPMPLTAGHEWELTMMNVKLPSKLTTANHALMMAERMATGQAAWSDECRQAFDRLMELTTCDLSGETYHKRVALARVCLHKEDPRWQQTGDRLMALIDHMGGDELMHRWIDHELPQLMADARVQHLVQLHKDYTLQQLLASLLTSPQDIGRVWLSGNRLLAAKRLYYAQLPQQMLVQLVVLMAMEGKSTVQAPKGSAPSNTQPDPSPREGADCSDDDALLSEGIKGDESASSALKGRLDVALSIMHDMQPQYTQKVDWLSPYSVLLRRRWVEDNLSAFCRLVGDQFGISLDNRTLSRVIRKEGTDYTRWTEADIRIRRRKRLAEEFDQRLEEYFKRKREEVMKGLRE